MKKNTLIAIALSFLTVATVPAQARDTQLMLPIAEGMQTPAAEGKLDDSVQLFFADQKHPKVLKKLGSDVTNRKTNAFGKSDDVACNWAFLSALISLQDKAKEVGANAVINIVSYYKKNEMASDSKFECHAGAIMAGVALKGDLVNLSDK
jgi:uncharacterized protein YbjQ (UPF0145 family)